MTGGHRGAVKTRNGDNMDRLSGRQRSGCVAVLALALALAALPASASALEDGFARPPQEARPWTYWYWINGHASEEGIVADIEAMDRAGVGGFLQMDIGFYKPGPVNYRSPEWWALVQRAAREAARRGMKMGVHCPGWSASGGPWIEPPMGMQELATAEIQVDGPSAFAGTLPQPGARLGYYRDVQVVAFATPKDESLSLTANRPQLTDANGKALDAMLQAVTDGNPETEAAFPPVFDLVFEQPVTARSLTVFASPPFPLNISLQAWNEADGQWVMAMDQLKEYDNFLHGPVGGTGFAPVTARKFRLSSLDGGPIRIRDFDLSGAARLQNWHSKAGYSPRERGASDLPEVQADGAVIDPDSIIDLTSRMDAQGRLTWAVPAGHWTILRVGHRPTGSIVEPAPPQGVGLETDKLSREATDFHYTRMMQPVFDHLGKELTDQILVNYHVDSFEAGYQNWTPRMPEEFAARRGYSLTPFLPALTGRIVKDPATTERFLWDFRQTISELFTVNHYDRLAELCHRDGLQFTSECYGGGFNNLRAYTHVDVPINEFWFDHALMRQRPPGPYPMAVSAAHIHGQPVIGAESFTSGWPQERWISHPYMIKPLGDWILCGGVNRLYLHVNVHQPYMEDHLKPGFSLVVHGTDFHRGNTWWPQGAAPWLQGVTRAQFILQQGSPVADILYFNGDDPFAAASPYALDLPDGVTGDRVDPEALGRFTVHEGRLVAPSGLQYRYLVTPKNRRMTLASLRVLGRLVTEGATVLGPVPEPVSPSLAEQAQAATRMPELIGQLWGDTATTATRRVGQGRVIAGVTIEQAMQADGVPMDFHFETEDDLNVRFTHRVIDGHDVYFVANLDFKPGRVEAFFRVAGQVPEFWHAETGVIEPCPLYAEADGVTRVTMQLEPAESRFVVFKPGPPQPHARRIALGGETQPPEWTLIRATWGPEGDTTRTLDVTQALASRIENHRLTLAPYERLAADPAPHVAKTLSVEYQMNGETRTVQVVDNQPLKLPPADPGGWGKLLVKNGVLYLEPRMAGTYHLEFDNAPPREILVDTLPAPLTVDGPWDVLFPAGWNVTGEPQGDAVKVTFDRLQSWSDHPDEGLKYFSGSATYHKTFNLDAPVEGLHYELDLGQVEMIAAVKLNGQEVGTYWKPPFRADVTPYVQAGENRLEIRVTNVWKNRIIGDEQYPEPGTLVPESWPSPPDWFLNHTPRPEPRRLSATSFRGWTAADPLAPSGLLGPVRLRALTRLPVVPPAAAPGN